MGKYSFVTLYDGRRMTVDRYKGDQMLRVLHGIEEPQNDKQVDFVLNIKSIYPELRTDDTDPETVQNQYWEKLDAQKARNKAVENGDHLTHKGIDQGMLHALPKGDRE